MLDAAPQQQHVTTSSIIRFNNNNNEVSNNALEKCGAVTAHKSSSSSSSSSSLLLSTEMLVESNNGSLNSNSSTTSHNLKSESLLNWHGDLHCQQALADSSGGKFSPELRDRSTMIMDDDDLGLNRLSPPPVSNDFAELKPLPYDFITVVPAALSSDLDPILGQPTSQRLKNADNVRSKQNTSRGGSTGSGGSDVTSSGSSSPHTTAGSSSSNNNNNNGLTKLETLDFTASQDAFDDLASIVGISMGADSTVLNGPCNESDELDLDAWIENTAQTIKPLLGDGSLESLLPTSLSTSTTTTSGNAHRPLSSSNFVQVATTSSTLQTLLLQGTATVLQPHQSQSSGLPAQSSTLLSNHPLTTAKATLLQQRESPSTQSYSILQNRLQHGPGAVIKVDSFDLAKINGDNNRFNNTCYPDSMPHSTTNQAVSTSLESQQSLHRRLGELAAAAAVAVGPNQAGPVAVAKAGQSKGAGRAGRAGRSVSKSNSNVSNNTSNSVGNSDGSGGKKLMHYCQICNRGFLNKSNIKVHLRTHTGEKPFKCEHCTKSFRQKAHLLKHMSIHKRISRD